MIGHYLLTLTPAQETLVLTTPFWGCRELKEPHQSCLITTTKPELHYILQAPHYLSRGSAESPKAWYDYSPASRYEYLCSRFGTFRVNKAIRNRILNNQLWRTLAEAPCSAII